MISDSRIKTSGILCKISWRVRAIGRGGQIRWNKAGLYAHDTKSRRATPRPPSVVRFAFLGEAIGLKVF
jgi:hypothetical protein